MESKKTKAAEASAVFAAPINEQNKPENSWDAPVTGGQLLFALLSYVAGWLFVRSFLCPENYAPWAIPALGAVLTFWELRAAGGRKAGGEHFLWLAVLWCCIFHAVFWNRMPLLFGVHVWDSSVYPVLFCIPLTAYWVLSRCGLLSGSLPLDGTRALIVFPFSGFGDRLRLMINGTKQFFGSSHRGFGKRLLMWLLSLGIGLIFLALVLPALGRADEGFAALLEKAGSWITMPQSDGFWFPRLLLSLPVGAWLYGLISRSASADPALMKDRGDAYAVRLGKLRRLPVAGHCVTLALFILIYCLFFYEQSRTLLSALRDRLAPGSLSMSQYAVKGFSDLCLVMGLTLALALVTVLTSDRSLTENRPGRVLLTILLVQSLLFAFSAGAKLCLYVQCFGYTPLRLQAAWGILVMAAAAVCALVQLWSGRKTTRIWCRFAGITLALTMLV